MYLERFIGDLEDIERCPPDVKRNLVASLKLLTAYRFFESIEIAANKTVLGLAAYEGITAEGLLDSAAKYRAITGLLSEVETLIKESETGI